MKPLRLALILIVLLPVTSGCEYVKLFRPSVLKQLNPDVVRRLIGAPRGDALFVFALP
jgi:hypothetical protein